MNKTNPSSAFKFDLNEPYYEEDEDIHRSKKTKIKRCSTVRDKSFVYSQI